MGTEIRWTYSREVRGSVLPNVRGECGYGRWTELGRGDALVDYQDVSTRESLTGEKSCRDEGCGAKKARPGDGK